MRDEAGFTLVEVLAALAVFSLAAVGLMQVSAQSVRTASALEQRFAARVMASNILSESIAQRRPLQRGTTAGRDEQLGLELDWSRAVSPATAGLLQITVTVSNPESGQVLVELSSLREDGTQ
ncbi:MAG: type II secretion system minor pseudopilin GspI [Pseudomonadota bacterium]